MKSLFLTLFICILTEIISGQSIDYNSVVQIKTQASFNTIQNRGGSLKIAYLPPATEFNFYLDIWKGISKAALDNGHEVFMLAPQIDNPSEQMRMLESILETDVSALILSTHDENSAAPFIQQAIEMGKVVIIINSDARSYSTAVHGIVGYVQQSGTFKLGKYALSLVEGRSMSVAIIEGEPGYHSTERVTGFEDAIKNSNLKIIDRYNGHWNTEGGYKAAIEMFQDHRDIDMVFAANDFEIIGVSAAMESLRLNDIYLFGNDGVSSILPLIYDGRITATVNTNPINMGKVAMQVVLDSFSGKFQGGFVETPTEIITNDNVVSFLSDHDKEAIALNPVEIRVVSEELPGLVNEDGTGLYCDILRSIYNPLGINLSIRIVPLKRALLMIKNNDADIMLGHSHSGIENVINPQWHYNTQIISAVFKKGKVKWEGQQNFIGKRVGWIRGADYDQYLRVPISALESNDHISPLLMLESERLDFYLEDHVELNRIFLFESDQLSTNGFLSSNYQIEPVLTLKIYPGFSDTPVGHKLTMIFDDRFPQLLYSEKLKELYEKWSINNYPF